MKMTECGERDDDETYYDLDNTDIETMMDETEGFHEELLGVINQSSADEMGRTLAVQER